MHNKSIPYKHKGRRRATSTHRLLQWAFSERTCTVQVRRIMSRPMLPTFGMYEVISLYLRNNVIMRVYVCDVLEIRAFVLLYVLMS